MKLLTKILVFILTIGIIAGSMPAAFAAFDLPDGGPVAEEEGNTGMTLMDFDDSSAVTKAGFISSQENTKDGKFSAYWNHNNKTNVDIKNAPTDLSEYNELNLSMYTKNGGGTQFVIVFMCNTGYFYTTITAEEGQKDYTIAFTNMKAQPGADWKDIKYIRFTSSGWSMTPSLESEYWINSFHVKPLPEGIARMYPSGDVEAAYAALEGNVAVYGGGRQIVTGKEVFPYKDIEWTEDTTAIPATLYEDYFDGTVGGTKENVVISANGKTVSLKVGSKEYSAGKDKRELPFAPYEKNGLVYVPGEIVSDILGFQTKVDKKLLIIGDEKVRNFDSNSKVSNMREIAGYLAYHEEIDPATITDEDIKLAKDRWRYSLVGDENIDLTDPSIKSIVEQIGKRGKASWDKMDKSNSDSLFLGRKPEKSPDMTSEYNQILYMALAWAQYGSEYYQDEDLLNDILYALEFQFENRYGYDEIENDPDKVWRDHTLTNWYDWQIDTPRKLTDILMLVDEHLTLEQKSDYMAFFDYWLYDRAYNSMKVDAGMNVLFTDKNWIGSMLLQEDRAGLLDAVSCLHNCFAWADTFVTREGFYSDGSYVFHYKHPMNGQYGNQQFGASGPILSIIAGTSFDFKNPRRENIYDWIYDAYEPIIYDGAIFRFVKGRAANANDHSIGRQIMVGCLDLLEFADAENAAKMKSLIKYNALNDKAVSYADSSLTVAQRQKLLDILNDESIKPREDYYISKTYHHMDKVVHQRKTWAFGVSMSSSRIYDYECIHGENTTGWYTSDGMTQLMLQNDQKQFTSMYWNNVDPYKYPGVTLDTQKREPHTIDTGRAFVKDSPFVGGVTIDDSYSVAAQTLNAFNLEEDITQTTGNVIKAHKSGLVAKKSWFMFDDEVVCLGAGINANDGFEVRTIVENRRSDDIVYLTPADEITESYEVVSVEASQTPQSDNVAQNTIDGDYGSKWAAENGAYITYDLGSVKTVGMVGFAFLNGSSRTQKMDIELSQDGEEWQLMFSGDSGGKTEAIETFDMKNTPARYVRFTNHGNSDGGTWVSLTETKIYGEYKDKAEVVEGVVIGGEKVVANGEEVKVTDVVTERSDANWVNLEHVAGYYFPEKGNLSMKKTTGSNSFFEMWLSHGVNPQDKGYSYVILPNMTAEQTGEYAANPGVEVLRNTDKISAVRDKSTGTTGVVFWEPGTFDGITVDKSMIIMYKDTESGLSIVAADPTHYMLEAKISTNRSLSPIEMDYRMELVDNNTAIKVKFDGSDGAGISGKFQKNAGKKVSMFFADMKGNLIDKVGVGEEICFKAPVIADNSEDLTLRIAQYSDKNVLLGVSDTKVDEKETGYYSMQVAALPGAATLRGYL